MSVRRRTLAKFQMINLRRHLNTGKPLVGIRTASHAFASRRRKPSPDGVEWPGFDAEILGGNYTGHHDNKGGTPPTYIWIAHSAD